MSDNPEAFKAKIEKAEIGNKLFHEGFILLDAKQAEAELKKYEKKAKKETAKDNEAKKEEKEKPKDDDPYGVKLLGVKDPLVELNKFIHPMQEHASSCIETHILTYEVSIRQSIVPFIVT